MKCISVACDSPDCDAVYTGMAWTTLWNDARKAGWRRQTGSIPAAHFCPICVEDIRRQKKAKRVVALNASSQRYADLAIKEATSFLNSNLDHSNHLLAAECIAIAKHMRDGGMLFQAKLYAICGIALSTNEITYIRDAIAMYHPISIDESGSEEIYNADLEKRFS